MGTYTYSSARQNLAMLLEEAKKSSSVFIKRKNGDLFKLIPVKPKKSPLDIPGIKSSITTAQIVSAVRESRERS